jgi:hypothetical protein
MTSLCFAVVNKENSSKQPIWNPMVVCLGVSASKFVDDVSAPKIALGLRECLGECCFFYYYSYYNKYYLTNNRKMIAT